MTIKLFWLCWLGGSLVLHVLTDKNLPPLHFRFFYRCMVCNRRHRRNDHVCCDAHKMLLDDLVVQRLNRCEANQAEALHFAERIIAISGDHQ